MKKLLLLIIWIHLAIPLLAQQVSITGIVRDETGLTLPGVSVYAKETAIGTTTDIDGKFSLSWEYANESYLYFSFMGYATSQKKVTPGTYYMEVTMTQEYTQLDEVVVIGYGSQRRGDLSSSIVSIRSEDVSSPAVLSLDQSLQGRAAGMIVSQSTGKPGAPVSIRIRGTSSINGVNEPLYVVDGIPIISNANDFTSGTIQGTDQNPLTSINPNDIESIQVLKDASATAIYGARGANGVILITTKQGKAGVTQVQFGSSIGIQQLSKKMDLLNANQLAVLGNDAVHEARKYYPGVAYNSAFAMPDRFGKGTDWQDQIFRTAVLHNHRVSISGGNESTTYYMSASMASQDGIIHNSDFGKGTFRVNISNRINQWLRTGINLNLSTSTNNGVTTGVPNVASSVTAMALFFNPGQEVYDPGQEGGYTYESNTLARIPNPVAEIKETEIKVSTHRVVGDYFADWNITDNLIFKFKTGVDGFFNKEQQYIPSYIKRGQDKGKGANVHTHGYTWLVENTLNYTFSHQKHHFNVLAGQTAQRFVSESSDIAVEQFDDNRLGYYNLSIATDKTILTGYNTWSMLSGIGRTMYHYDNKYYVTVSGRLDGSSKFGSSNRYGFFPSISTAWRVSGEPFMQPFSLINDLKLRASLGKVGNEGIPSGASLSLMGNRPYYFGEGANAQAVGTYVHSLENQDLKWEVTTQYDVGIDLSLWESRLEFTAEAYLKHTSDLLLFMPVNTSSGFDYVWTNVGDLQNKGLDFSLNTVNLKDDFKWNTRFNLSFNRNKVTNLDKSSAIYGNPVMGIVDWSMIQEGKPIGVVYGYESNGIIQLDEDPGSVPFFPAKIPRHGDRKYVDQNGDGILTVDDYVELGNTHPDFSFGIHNTFSYKNFTLNVFIQGDYGNVIVNFNRLQLESFDGFQNNSTAALQRWTESNPTNKYPRANASPHGHVMSDVIVEDGSYARLKEITLTYRVPRKLYTSTLVKDIQMSVSAHNLATLTNYSGYDPEVSIFGGSVYGKGADYGAYPMARTFIFSINASF